MKKRFTLCIFSVLAIATAAGLGIALRYWARVSRLDEIVASIEAAKSSSEEARAVGKLWNWAARRQQNFYVTYWDGDSEVPLTRDEVMFGPLRRIRARVVFTTNPGSIDVFCYECSFHVNDPNSLNELEASFPPSRTAFWWE